MLYSASFQSTRGDRSRPVNEIPLFSSISRQYMAFEIFYVGVVFIGFQYNLFKKFRIFKNVLYFFLYCFSLILSDEFVSFNTSMIIPLDRESIASLIRLE